MLNQHIDKKHNGGKLTERETIARMLVECYANRKLKGYILKSVKIKLYPGLITKTAKKLDLAD